MNIQSFTQQLKTKLNQWNHDLNRWFQEQAKYLDEEPDGSPWPNGYHGPTKRHVKKQSESAQLKAQEIKPKQVDEGTIPYELYEYEGCLFLLAELPGVTSQQIDLELKYNQLILRIEKRNEHGDHQNLVYHHQERIFGNYQRTLFLPCEVLIDQCQAHCKEGILKVKLPISQSSSPNRIKVSIH